LARREFDFSAIDHWLDLADQAIRRVQRVLGEYAEAPAAAATDNVLPALEPDRTD